MVSNNIQTLADKIAKLLETEPHNPETAALFAGIDKINHRLDKLEAVISDHPTTAQQLFHPSQEKYTVVEAFADEIVAGIKQEKTCTFEPNGRPCDHCSMCSSRGF